MTQLCLNEVLGWKLTIAMNLKLKRSNERNWELLYVFDFCERTSNSLKCGLLGGKNPSNWFTPYSPCQSFVSWHVCLARIGGHLYFFFLTSLCFFFTWCTLLRSFKCSGKFVQNGHCTSKMQDYLFKVQLWKNCRRNLWIFSNFIFVLHCGDFWR